MSELKACHSCGSSKAKIMKVTHVDGSLHSWKAYCPICQVRTGPEKTKKAAINRWNTRHIPEGYALVPIEPTERLLESMAMRYRHDFGLLDTASQRSVMTAMKQIHEEVVGTGFYKAAQGDE